MTRSLFLSLLLMCNLAYAQMKPKDWSIAWDYRTTEQSILTGGDRKQVGGNIEYSINEMFTLELQYNRDQDGFAPYRGVIGYGVKDLNGHRYSHLLQDAYLGIRLYPAENYHSQALSLRDKNNYGFYISMGYALQHFQRHNYNIETYTSSIVDSITSMPIYRTDSAFIHYNGFNITQWGMNFGVGWKQYHSKYVYTDISVYSNVFRPQNRRVEGYLQLDPDREQQLPFISQSFWDDYIGLIDVFAKNGKGFVLHASIGVNLDIRKR